MIIYLGGGEVSIRELPEGFSYAKEDSGSRRKFKNCLSQVFVNGQKVIKIFNFIYICFCLSFPHHLQKTTRFF